MSDASTHGAFGAEGAMSGEPEPSDRGAEGAMSGEVDIDEGRRRLGAGALMLDVRGEDEWEAGHVEGSAWIPMRELEGRRDELPRDREILVICRSGGRSAKSAEALTKWGYDARNVAGGAQAWAEAGHTLVRDDGTPGVVA
jgi:rhodanese-related sulfurtransferase